MSIIAFGLSHLFEVPRLVHSRRYDLQYLPQVERADTENAERASALLVVGQPDCSLNLVFRTNEDGS
jgi:hypothetical protein